jgi:formylmethanofuran dehydrogenase subunit E
MRPEIPIQEAIEKVTAFHGRYAPGTVIAVYMVALAQKNLQPLKGKLNAIAESTVCLADAIQIMTGCTLGNKYLWLMNYGRYALCLYDRETKEGVRIFVDYPSIDTQKTPLLRKFFDGTRTYESVPRPKQQLQVIEEFLTVKNGLFGVRPVFVNLPEKRDLPSSAHCPSCGEWFKTFSNEVSCKDCTETSLYRSA